MPPKIRLCLLLHSQTAMFVEPILDALLTTDWQQWQSASPLATTCTFIKHLHALLLHVSMNVAVSILVVFMRDMVIELHDLQSNRYNNNNRRIGKNAVHTWLFICYFLTHWDLILRCKGERPLHTQLASRQFSDIVWLQLANNEKPLDRKMKINWSLSRSRSQLFLVHLDYEATDGTWKRTHVKEVHLNVWWMLLQVHSKMFSRRITFTIWKSFYHF